MDLVFYQSAPRGLKLSYDKPLASGGISAYLRDKGYALGYHQTLTFYAIRRMAATDLVRRIGAAAAREILGHSPDTCKFSFSTLLKSLSILLIPCLLLISHT